MTTLTRTDAPSGSTEDAGSGGRTGWLIAGATALVATIAAVATASTGVSDDPRLANPNPGVPPEEPLWGIDNWPTVFSAIFIVFAVGLLIGSVWLSVRQRRVHPYLIVFMGVTALSWMDPPANWVTYTVFDPDFLHFPTDWPYIRLAPLVEPIVNVPGYPMYFLTVAIVGVLCANAVLRRARPESWMSRHPLATVFIVGCAVGFVWDIATELFMIRAHMYFYSQSWGPTIGAGHGRFPLVWGFYTWWAIGAVTLLLFRDDRGRSHVLAKAAERLPSRRRADAASRAGTARQTVAAVLLLSAFYVVPTAFYGTLRVTGIMHPNISAWNYAETNVYDPYGDLEQAGIPGPYYK